MLNVAGGGATGSMHAWSGSRYRGTNRSIQVVVIVADEQRRAFLKRLAICIK